MANPELFTVANSITVKGIHLSNVQGFPTLKDKLPHIEQYLPQNVLVSVPFQGNENFTSIPEAIPLQEINGQLHQVHLVRPTREHGRSYQLHIPELEPQPGTQDATYGQKTYFLDEYGNLFMDLSLKGNNLSNPNIGKSDVAPSGYMIRGLQDSDSMVRVLKASDLLRQQGVETEIILQVVQPEELPIGEEIVPLDEFKRRLIQQVWDKPNGSISRDDIPKLSEILDGMTLFVTTRGMQTALRMQNLQSASTSEEFGLMMSKVYDYVNQDTYRKQGKNSTSLSNLFFHYCPDEVAYSHESKELNRETATRYFKKEFPKRLGRNYGKLHSLGLHHRYSHTGNIGLTGGIYDLDSVWGETLGLGDTKPTPANIISELEDLTSPERMGIFAKLDSKGFIYYGSGFEDAFKKAFFKSYFETRNLTGDVLGNFAEIWAIQRTDLQDFNDVEIKLKLALKEQYGFNTNGLLTKAELRNFYVDTQKRKSLAYLNFYRGEISEEDLNRNLSEFPYGFKPFPEVEVISEKLNDYLLQKLIDKNKKAYTDISTRLGEEAASTIFEIFSYSASEKGIGIIDKTIKEDKSIKIEVDSYIMEVVRGLGWEDDLPRYISILNKQWDESMGNSVHEHYYRLLLQQLNLEGFKLPRDVIRDAFVEEARENVEKAMQNTIVSTPDGKSVNSALRKTFKEYKRYWHFVSDGICDLIASSDYLQKYLESNFPEQISHLVIEYGEDSFRALRTMVTNEILESWNDRDNEADTMLKRVEEAEKEVFQKYLDNPDLPFNPIPYAQILELGRELNYDSKEDEGTVYLNRALEALNWEYKYDLDFETKLPEVARKYQQAIVSNYFGKVVETENLEAKTKVFDKASNLASQYPDNDSIFLEFVCNEIQADIREKFADQIPAIKEEYGEDNIKTILDWILWSERSRMREELTLKQHLAIDEDINAAYDRAKRICLYLNS